MVSGEILIIGSAILCIVAIFAGDLKGTLYSFAGIVIGAFITFDLPKIIENF